MTQVQKEAIRQQIQEAALTLFASNGYEKTSMADVAKKAGVSVGNVYRYYCKKRDLLEELLPEEFIVTLKRQTLKKIKTGKAETIIEQLQDAAYLANTERFLEYLLANRVRFLVLMRCTKEKQYANVKEELLEYLVQIFLDNFVENIGDKEKLKIMLMILYRSFIDSFTAVLSMDLADTVMLEQMKILMRYHVAGLASLLEKK